MVTAKRKFTNNYTTYSNCMEDLYIFHDELGSGGFGKVKSATHVLSGEKVAVKVIDKKAVGDDLPRVTTELEALKHLAHQNICRMFQYVETDEKFYIVMEYCNGGEMFDYIVRRERLEESEARHFFRQLVQAIAYVHSVGFAHRDLKPENLLLKEDLQLKVIDFGLCARPRHGLSRPLETCCGSPAYAAPELIQNAEYYGNEADIWSMGVLLYALLCGALPFEDESMPKLYKKIMQGVYHEPSFLSKESKELMRSMLNVNPRRRITIKELLVHPWLNKNYHQPLKYTTIYDKNVIDEDVARELAFFYSTPLAKMISLLKEWKFDYVTATYLILLQKKERRQNFVLPFLRATGQNTYSPTIHASLEMDMDRQGTKIVAEAGMKHCQYEKRAFSKIAMKDVDMDDGQFESPFEKSYAMAIELGSPMHVPSPHQQIQRIFCRTNPNPANAASLMKELATPKRNSSEHKLSSNYYYSTGRKGTQLHHYHHLQQQVCTVNKENQQPVPNTVRAITANQKAVANSTTVGGGFLDENGRPKSVYSTPRRAPITGVLPSMYRRPRSTDCEHSSLEVPSQIPSSTGSSQPATSKASADAITTIYAHSASAEYISVATTEDSLIIGKNASIKNGGSTLPPDAVAVNKNAADKRGRTPRSDIKTPRLRQRVFKSLERKADKMINMLTPRKMRHDSGPARVKSNNILNLTVTSSNDPYKVRDELIRVLKEQGIPPVQNGWKVSGSKKSADGMGGQMTVEYEVVLLESMENVGVRRRRLSGDAFLYKRVCEEVLKFANRIH